MHSIETIGDDVLSVAVKKPGKRHAIARTLRGTGTWLECVEGRQSVAVTFDATSISLKAARKQLRRQLKSVTAVGAGDMPLLEIPVCYGGEFGPELASICEMLDLQPEELIHIHTSRQHRVDMLGFTPGFAYIDGLSGEINVPRLSEPRQRVAAGSVGLAGGQTGLYAFAGPGGWPLVGRTPVRLFDPAVGDGFLLHAGTRIRFRSIDETTYRQMLDG